jgi:hypothetical protein
MLNLSMGGYSSCRRSTRVRLSRDKEFNVRLKELKIKLDNVKKTEGHLLSFQLHGYSLFIMLIDV